jgi:hypothetical protein
MQFKDGLRVVMQTFGDIVYSHLSFRNCSKQQWKGVYDTNGGHSILACDLVWKTANGEDVNYGEVIP